MQLLRANLAPEAKGAPFAPDTDLEEAMVDEERLSAVISEIEKTLPPSRYGDAAEGGARARAAGGAAVAESGEGTLSCEAGMRCEEAHEVPAEMQNRAQQVSELQG